MKTILFNYALIIGSALCFAGCGVNGDSTSVPSTSVLSKERCFKLSTGVRIYSIEIEGHEYIIFDGSSKGGIIHSESCPCRKGDAE